MPLAAGPARWTWYGASVAGTSHAATGSPCQDKAWIGEVRGSGATRHLVAVVCDGAGSCEHGAEGARLAVEAFASTVVARLAAGGIGERDVGERGADVESLVAAAEAGARAAADAIAVAAAAMGLAAHSHAATLVACIASEGSVAVAQVGDGACALLCEGGWRLPLWPAQGEYAGTTDFLSDANPAVRTVPVGERVEAIALFTDGLERLALDFAARTPHAPFLDAMARPLGRTPGMDEALSLSLVRFLASDRVNARTDDDKTLVLARRLASTP